MHLLIVDTTGIQPYIFGSNRLRENVGASYLVKQATEAWAREALDAVMPNQHNWLSSENIDGSKRIEDDSLEAEVIYASGGNVLIIFREPDKAKTFARTLSKRVLCDAPGLQLVIAIETFGGIGNGELPIDQVFAQLERRKQRGDTVSTPLLGLGVTVRCQSTGLPAVGYVTYPDSANPVSSEVLAKWRAGDDSHTALQGQFQDILGQTYAFPKDMDDLGRSEGEHSYVAIVHADGNSMGNRIQAIRQIHADDREYINQIRTFSCELNAATQRALTSTLKLLVGHIENGVIKHPNPELSKTLVINLKQEDSSNRWFLPFRPIVIGGDDVTFICDGRLGISLANHFLHAFEQETASLPDGKGKATACAGIAIVKSHYPFARAYALAEELTTRNAKAYRQKLPDYDGACIDWHMAFSGLYGSIETIRNREYSNGLTIRPLTLEPNATDKDRSWTVLQPALHTFQCEKWLGKRNKMKALREALRQGEAEVERFCTMYGQELPDVIAGAGEIRKKGYYNSRTPYFDAIELADWYIPLDKDHEQEGGGHDDA